MDENNKFKWGDICTLKLPFWLLCGSCFVEYMVVIVYVANAEDMLLKRFGFNEKQASLWYATPYLISAFACPIIGITINKVGKRVLFVTTSSIFLLLSSVTTAILPPSDNG